MVDPQRTNENIVERRAPIPERQVERLVGMIIRNETCIKRAREMLSIDDFAEHQRGLATIYSVALDFYHDHTEMPEYTDIVGEIERRLEESPEGLSDDELGLMDNFLKLQFNLDDEYFEQPKIQKVFRKMLQMFLEDRTTDKIREDFSSQSTVDIFGYLKDLEQKTSKIRMAGTSSVPDLYGPGWSDNPVLIEQRGTTIPFLDVMLDGGDGCGEVNGLLAPFGTCKTTVAVQMGCGRARLRRQEWLRSNKEGPLGLVYLFIYEGTIGEMRKRALCCAGQIKTDRLKDLRDLHGPGRYEPYEQQLFRDMFNTGTRVPCEQQRVRAVSQSLNTNFRVVPMMGHADEDDTKRGTGYVEELAAVLSEDMMAQKEKYKCEVFVETVIVDYVGAAVERAAMVHNWNESIQRQKIEKFSYHLHQEVAVPYHCPCWCLHQYSGNANSFAPGRVPKGTDAKGTKSFKEPLDFLVTVGAKNHDGLCCWQIDKARRADTTQMPTEVVFIDGAFGMVRSVSNEFVLDTATQEIVSVSELRGMFADQSQMANENEYDGVSEPTELVQTQMREISQGRRRRRS